MPPQDVEQNQRERLAAATARILAERGYAEMTVADITAYAGVSRLTFYKFFDNKQDCLLAAYQAVFERFIGHLQASCEDEGEWNVRLRAAIAASLSFMAERPDEAKLLTLDGCTATLPLAEEIRGSRRRLAALLGPAREQLAAPISPPKVTELALVGAMLSVASDRLIATEADPVAELVPQLHFLAMTPYLGPEEAQRIAASGAVGEGPS